MRAAVGSLMVAEDLEERGVVARGVNLECKKGSSMAYRSKFPWKVGGIVFGRPADFDLAADGVVSARLSGRLFSLKEIVRRAS